MSLKASLSVSQLTAKIKGTLESELAQVWVRGEISGLKPSASGHVYFSLKDNAAVVSCAMFGAGKNASRIRFNAKDGVEVLAFGRISVYAPRGNYQLIVEHLEPLGSGALQLAFEQLKKKLMAEGLFDDARKRPLPSYPKKIAVVTSPTGAALHDILSVLNRRNAGISVLVVPTLVQGEQAADQIVSAIQTINKYNLGELVLLARGGGSLEDLWCFNDERVVRAIAASRLPVVSAVGHEVDFTLSDFVADLRAPTPSAAAEIISRSKIEILDSIASTERKLILLTQMRIAHSRAKLMRLENAMISPSEKLIRLRQKLVEARLKLIHQVQSFLPYYRQRIDEVLLDIQNKQEKLILAKKNKIEVLSGQLQALSPLKVLGRGYTLIRDSKDGTLLQSIREATPGREVSLVFKDGKANARFF